jgi:hypothetical protein
VGRRRRRRIRAEAVSREEAMFEPPDVDLHASIFPV